MKLYILLAYRGKGDKETAARLLQEAADLDAVTAEKYAE
jgi:hypothetical protein